MLIDLTSLKIDSTIDVSLLILILGVFSYYFGKLIEETKPTNDVKQVTYMSGIFFIFFFILFPSLIIYQFSDYLIFIKPTFLPLFVCFILQSLLFFFLHKRVQAYQVIKAGYTNLLNEKTEIYTQRIMDNLGLSRFSKADKAKDVNQRFLLNKLSDGWLLLIVFIELLIFINVILVSDNLLFCFAIFAYLFLSIANIAILYGWRQVVEYPYVKVELIDKEAITGKLMKIEDGYVNIRNDKRVYHINKEQIRFITREENPNLSKTEEKIEKTGKLIGKLLGGKR